MHVSVRILFYYIIHIVNKPMFFVCLILRTNKLYFVIIRLNHPILKINLFKSIISKIVTLAGKELTLFRYSSANEIW